ncbi:hypothetical protein [Sphingomonas sp.]|uniref:hypothetical protein n=1 Tax=Sphingomonas sp. TaxID=28214 RepID=UPI00286E4B6A|nr:hypothetical protein [Sphingomonas sp.]
MKHFINPELAAANAMTVAVDEAIVREFLPLAAGSPDDADYQVERPQWDSDIRWISARHEASFAHFQSAFDRLGVAAHVRPFLDLEREVRLYAGFVVVRSECRAAHFHVDWEKTNNEAFTLLTPITANAAGFGLVYRTVKGTVADYDYTPGEAIIFGDHFSHSTRPGASPDPVALLCFNFGTDKMAHWDKIYRTTGYQTAFLRQPDGRFHRRGDDG